MGTLGILWTSAVGQNRPKIDPKKVTMGENVNKNEQNSQTSFFFSWLPRKYMKIRVSVHMGTKKRLLVSGGG